jgi:hypothetical protein
MQYELHYHTQYVLVNMSGVSPYVNKTDWSQTLNHTSSMYDVNKDTKRKEAQLQHF